MNAAILILVVALVAALLALAHYFRGLLSEMEDRLTSASRATESALSASLSRSESALKRHTLALGLSAEADSKRLEDFLRASVAGDYKDVLSVKADLLGEVARLHSRFDGIQDSVSAAARSVMIAPRRTCAFCGHVVHLFELQADGSVKCTDCKAAGR